MRFCKVLSPQILLESHFVLHNFIKFHGQSCFTITGSMLRTPAARKLFSALRCRQPCQSNSCQHFSSTAPVAAISPHKRTSQLPPATPEPARRGQSTAAAPVPYAATATHHNHRAQSADSKSSQTRPRPSPAFNTEPTRHQVHPLQNAAAPEMDES